MTTMQLVRRWVALKLLGKSIALVVNVKFKAKSVQDPQFLFDPGLLRIPLQDVLVTRCTFDCDEFQAKDNSNG